MPSYNKLVRDHIPKIIEKAGKNCRTSTLSKQPSIMAVMIEELNEVPSINYLLGKVESIAKRSSLSMFEQILLDRFENTCFY